MTIAFGGLVTNVGARRNTVNADERPGVSLTERTVAHGGHLEPAGLDKRSLHEAGA
jgi:hypothetical protein